MLDHKYICSERKEQRKKTRIVAECTTVEDAGTRRDHFLAYTYNISVSGAHLVVSSRVKCGDRVMISFEIPTYFLPVTVCAEVLWTKDVARPVEPVHFVREAGVRFLHNDERTRHKLEVFTEYTLYREAYEMVS